jgi:hypothetical protein
LFERKQELFEDLYFGKLTPMNFWSQNLIHDNLPQPFHHFKPARSKNEFEVTISGGL